MKLRTKALYAGAWVVIATAIMLISLVTYWLVRPYAGLYDVNAPFQVTPVSAPAGTLVTYTVKYCVDENLPLPITVTREMEMQGPHGYIFPIAPSLGYLIQNRCETRELAFGIPSYVPPGEYHIHYNSALTVNPFRTIQQSFVSSTFTVTEANK